MVSPAALPVVMSARPVCCKMLQMAISIKKGEWRLVLAKVVARDFRGGE